MTVEGLSFITNCLNEIGMPYEFMEWSSVPVPDTYWTGEYTESEPMNEDGMEESTFILTGTTNKKFLELELVKYRVKQMFPPEGLCAILENGEGICVYYSDGYPIPSIQEGVHRLQINIKVKEWRC